MLICCLTCAGYKLLPPPFPNFKKDAFLSIIQMALLIIISNSERLLVWATEASWPVHSRTSRLFLFFVTRALHAARQASTLEQLALPGCPDFPHGYLFSKTHLPGLLAGLPIVGSQTTPIHGGQGDTKERGSRSQLAGLTSKGTCVRGLSWWAARSVDLPSCLPSLKSLYRTLNWVESHQLTLSRLYPWNSTWC